MVRSSSFVPVLRCYAASIDTSLRLNVRSNGTEWQWHINKNTPYRVDNVNHRFALRFNSGPVDFSENSRLRLEVYASTQVTLSISLQDSYECDASTAHGFADCHTLPTVWRP